MASVLFTIGGAVVNTLVLAAVILSSVGSQIMVQKNAKNNLALKKL